jgi:hypothetical protein
VDSIECIHVTRPSEEALKQNQHEGDGDVGNEEMHAVEEEEYCVDALKSDD